MIATVKANQKLKPLAKIIKNTTPDLTNISNNLPNGRNSKIMSSTTCRSKNNPKPDISQKKSIPKIMIFGIHDIISKPNMKQMV